MLGQNKIIAFVATRNSERSREFYEKTLGLRLVGVNVFAIVFDAAGTMLRVVKVDSLAPTPFTVLGWDVENIEDTVGKLASRGISFEVYPGFGQDDRGIWNSPPGARIAWFKDPDGNVLSLTQHRRAAG
jgi:catechol 2,3-dioxygenase-like lactoylglutathione lyase family enzyme